MNTRSIIIATLLILGSLISYSQVVASIDVAPSLIPTHDSHVSQLSYAVVDSESNVEFESINYSACSQNLTLKAEDKVICISVFQDGEVFLKNMPILTDKLNLSMKNYVAGDYELHLTVASQSDPTIIEITKS